MSRDPVAGEPFRTGSVAIALAAAAFCILSYSPEHYWDEYFYLYSTWQHPVRALLDMEAGLADGLFPNGFFSGKLAFVAMLRGLVTLTGPGEPALLALRLIFCAVMLAVGGATWLLARELAGSRLAGGVAVVALLLPVPLYLGVKVLSEGPSLLLATLGGWQLLRAARTTGTRAAVHLLLSGSALALAVLMRVAAELFLAGFLVALFLARPADIDRRRLSRDVAAVLAIHAAMALAIFLLVVGWPAERLAALAGSVTGRRPDPLVSAYGVALFVQFHGLLALLALTPPISRLTWAALAWIAVAVAPYVLAAQYLEPRYFYTATLPLALLAASGLARVTRLLAAVPRRLVWLGALGLTVGFNRLIWSPMMPYEIRETDYRALIGTLDTAHPTATYVTPWVTDFCYLAFAFPSERVALAMSETYGSGRLFSAPEFRRWLGTHPYAGDLSSLAGLPRPWFYVGWDYSPTVRAIDERLRLVGLVYLDDPARRARLLNHLTPSWIWSSEGLRLEQVATSGPYTAYRIVPAEQR